MSLQARQRHDKTILDEPTTLQLDSLNRPEIRTMTTVQTPNTTPAIVWKGDTNGHLQLIDQTLLPVEIKLLDCRDVETVWEAIKMLRVRGAPAIGISAAYGVVTSQANGADPAAAKHAIEYLATSRPTAVNLFLGFGPHVQGH